MASIRKCASEVIDTARAGMDWFILWKTGRSWHVMEITAEEYDYETATYVLAFPEDKKEIDRILAEDPNAVFLNGYYCNLGDEEAMTVNSLADALRWQYEDGGNLSSWTFKSETEQSDCTEPDNGSAMAQATDAPISYKEFLSRIDDFVGCIVEFTVKRKQDGYISHTQRYVWDNKEFGELKQDSLIEIFDVRFVRKGKLDKSVKGIVAVQ